MDVFTVLAHMKGQSLTVNGTRYEVGSDGVIRDMKSDDAAKLISGSLYMDAAEVPAVVKPPVKAPEVAKVEISVVEEVPVKEEVSESAILDDAGTPIEYPDPHVDLGPKKLREMADAYEVKYTKNMKPETLVNRLNEAMYE